MASSDTSGSPDSSEEPLNGKTVLVTGANSGIGYQTALGLAEALGFEGVDAGGIVRSRALEHLAVLWIAQSRAGDREHALGVLRR